MIDILILMAFVMLFAASIVVPYIIKRRNKKRFERLVALFNRLGRKYDLDFDAQEALKDVMIGIDEEKRKLLIVQSVDRKYDWNLVDLDDVRFCNVHKVYRRINVGSMKGRRFDRHLSRLLLQIVMKGSRGWIEVPFFIFGRNNLFEVNDIRRRANYWQSRISDAVHDEARLRA